MSQGAGDNSSGIGKHRLIAIIFLLITLLMVSSIIPFYGTSVPYTSQFSTGHGSSATGHTSTGQTPSVVNPSSPAILPAIIAQARSTTGFDNSWLISQAGYRGTSNGTLTGNVFHARIYNVISNVTGAFGPWGYSVIQKGLLDWGPATLDHLNGTLLTVTVKFNAAVNMVVPYDWHVYVGVYYHLTQPVTVNCNGVPTTRQFLDAQIQLARAFPPGDELCATDTAVLSPLQQNLVGVGQTYTLSNYNITAHFLSQARAIGLPSNIGYTEYSLEPGIEGYGNSIVSADFSNLSVATPPNPKSPIIDGVGQDSGITGWNSAILSTTHPKDLIIVATYCNVDFNDTNANICDNQNATITDSAGLSFKSHNTYCYTGSNGNSCIRDYFTFASSILTGDNITVSPFLHMFAFAVSNYSPAHIFDRNLPVTNHCSWIDGTGPFDYANSTSASNCTVNFTPNNPHNLVFEMTVLHDSNNCTGSSTMSGWTLMNGYAWAEISMKYPSEGGGGNNSNSFSCDSSHYPVIEMVDGIQGPIK